MTKFASSVDYYCQREGSEYECTLLVNSGQTSTVRVAIAEMRRGFVFNRLLLTAPTTSSIILEVLLGNLFLSFLNCNINIREGLKRFIKGSDEL